jgi:hypothetical protein
MSSALLAMAAFLAALAPPAAAKTVPMSVRVEATATNAPAVADWVQELSTALAARKDEFRLAKEKEKAQFVVRLDSVAAGAGGRQVLAGTLVLGEVKRPFTYSFTNVRAEAEKLARNLRAVADQMQSTGK